MKFLTRSNMEIGVIVCGCGVEVLSDISHQVLARQNNMPEFSV